MEWRALSNIPPMLNRDSQCSAALVETNKTGSGQTSLTVRAILACGRGWRFLRLWLLLVSHARLAQPLPELLVFAVPLHVSSCNLRTQTFGSHSVGWLESGEPFGLESEAGLTIHTWPSHTIRPSFSIVASKENIGLREMLRDDESSQASWGRSTSSLNTRSLSSIISLFPPTNAVGLA